MNGFIDTVAPSNTGKAYTSRPVEGHRPAGNPALPAEAPASIVSIDDVDIVEVQPQQKAEGVVVIVVTDDDGSGGSVVVAMMLLSMTVAMIVTAVGWPSTPFVHMLDDLLSMATAVADFTAVVPVQAVTVAVLDRAALVALGEPRRVGAAVSPVGRRGHG